ncbi:MAG: hypothetical protein LBQ60_11780, partial [Bacteroidales bacterium]|nr:hypothetical protein [Bacteroidales bacterium]
ELFESAVPLSYDDMPFTISSTLGLPPSKLVAATNSYDNAWINAQAFKVTMKANEKIRINVVGAGLKIFLKEYDMYNQATYKQTSRYSNNVLYADKDGDYYIVVSSDIKNGNVDFSLKIDHITGLCSRDDVLDNAKPSGALPCKMSGILNEQSNMVDNGFYLYYATAYRLHLKAGTAVKIERGYDRYYSSVVVYQKIDNTYQLAPVYPQYPDYGPPISISAEKSGDYYIIISSDGLKNSEYDLKITETSIPVTYKELIDATPDVTAFPFVGSGTLNNEHATLVKGDQYFGGESCYFSRAYKLSLESGTVLAYNLTSDEVEKRLYIYDSQTYNRVHTNDAGQGSYLVTKSGNYHVIITTKKGLDEGNYTLKMGSLSEVSMETLLENAQPISVPTSFTDALGGDSEPCVIDNFSSWGGYGNYYAKTYKFHLDKDESIQIKAASDFLYPGMSLARKNLQGKFVTLISMTTGSLKYQAKESGDYYLTVASPYSRPLTSGDFTLTIQPFSYSTLDDLFANAGELFFDENLSCSVSGSLEEAPLILEKGQTKYNDRYYFAQAYKIKLEEGIHLMTYIQSANYPPYIRLFKKENNEYKLINKDYNLSYPFLVDETDEYYIVIYAYENYEKTDFTLYLKTFIPVTLNDLFADASEFIFPGSVSGTFERGKSPYLFSDGYSFVQAYKMNISAKTNIVAALSSSIDAGSFMIYKKNGNNYEMVSYYTSYHLKELEPGEYYFIVYGPVYTDSHYVLRVDGITGQDSLESLFRNAQTVDGQTDLSYIYSCDFIKHSVPVIEFEKQTCKAKAFKLENFSSIQHQIEFASNKNGNYFLCLYEKNGNEYTMIDRVHDWEYYLSSTFTPSPGKEYFVLLAVDLYGTYNNSYTLKITNIHVSESKIPDIKLEGGHYVRIPSTFTEEDIKELLSNKKIIPKVGHGEITPAIRNSVSCWTVNPTLTQATGLFEAPEGYQFSDGTGTIVVDFNSP